MMRHPTLAAALGLAFIAGTTAPAAGAAEARPRVPVQSLDELGADETFQAFRRDLADAVARRDRGLVESLLSPGFYHRPDSGSAFDPAATPAGNLAAAFGLDGTPEQAEAGWRRLARLAAAGSHEWLPEGDACGPSEPVALGLPADVGPEDFVLTWGAVVGTDVNVRAAPDGTAEVIGRLSNEAVEVANWQPAGAAADGPGWIEIRTPDGETGFVAERYVVGFREERLCYGRDAEGRWRIAGVIGGGE